MRVSSDAKKNAQTLVSQPVKVKNFTVIIKTVERCNINCSYCYFFNGLDDSYKFHSKRISRETIANIAKFIRQGCIDLAVTDVLIEFHGGEPMMQKLSEFDNMCQTLIFIISPVVKRLDFCMQTNATLVTLEWLAVLRKYNVNVGVSIDGPPEYNDKYRIDHKGKGTYTKIVKGLKLLQKYLTKKNGEEIGVLCVINPEFSGKKIYRHFVDILNLKEINFILPDYHYSNPPSYSIDSYANYLIEVFDEWQNDRDPTIQIRCLKNIIRMMIGGEGDVYGIASDVDPTQQLPLITISSDGDLSPVDELRSTDPALMFIGATVKNTTLAEYVNHDIFHRISKAQATLPQDCQSCQWKQGCGAGGIVNRYCHENRSYDNPTIYCNAMKKLCSHIERAFVAEGFSVKKLLQQNQVQLKKASISDVKL